MNEHREKYIGAVLGLMILFFSTFTIAIISLKNNYSLFNIGIPPIVESWMIIILSIIFIVKLVYELAVA